MIMFSFIISDKGGNNMEHMKKESFKIMQSFSSRSNESFLFVPGMFLLLIGMAAIIAPKFVISLVAGFFIFLGVLVTIIAYKLVKAKRRLESMMKSMTAEIRVDAPFIDILTQSESAPAEDERKKIIIH